MSRKDDRLSRNFAWNRHSKKLDNSFSKTTPTPSLYLENNGEESAAGLIFNYLSGIQKIANKNFNWHKTWWDFLFYF